MDRAIEEEGDGDPKASLEGGGRGKVKRRVNGGEGVGRGQG